MLKAFVEWISNCFMLTAHVLDVSKSSVIKTILKIRKVIFSRIVSGGKKTHNTILFDQ